MLALFGLHNDRQKVFVFVRGCENSKIRKVASCGNGFLEGSSKAVKEGEKKECCIRGMIRTATRRSYSCVHSLICRSLSFFYLRVSKDTVDLESVSYTPLDVYKRQSNL